jgi:hypothetical protein
MFYCIRHLQGSTGQSKESGMSVKLNTTKIVEKIFQNVYLTNISSLKFMMKPSENFRLIGLAAFVRIRTNIFLFLVFQLYQFVVTNFSNIFSDCKNNFTPDSGQCVSLPRPLKIVQLQLGLSCYTTQQRLTQKNATKSLPAIHKITLFFVGLIN